MPAVSKSERAAMAIQAEVLAYIAGFMDGEGCITMRRSNRKTVQTPTYGLVVSFTNRDISTLRWIQGFFGGKIYPKARKKSNHSPAWELTIFRRGEVAFCLDSIGPWLRVKSKQAEIAREFLKLGVSRKIFEARGKTWPLVHTDAADTAIKEDFKQQLGLANRRGYLCPQ